MEALGFSFEGPEQICYHLFSVKIGVENIDRMKTLLAERNLSLSIRGPYLRISLSVYNTAEDLAVLADALSHLLKENQQFTRS